MLSGLGPSPNSRSEPNWLGVMSDSCPGSPRSESSPACRGQVFEHQYVYYGEGLRGARGVRERGEAALTTNAWLPVVGTRGPIWHGLASPGCVCRQSRGWREYVRLEGRGRCWWLRRGHPGLLMQLGARVSGSRGSTLWATSGACGVTNGLMRWRWLQWTSYQAIFKCV